MRIPGGVNFDPTPNYLKVRMRYSQVKTITIPNGYLSYGHTVFRANSVYDPDYTGVGRRALGLSLYDDLYGLYRVTKATIRVQTISNDAQGLLFVGKSNAPALTSADTNRVLEKKGTVVSRNRSAGDKSGMCWNKWSMNEDLQFKQADWVKTNDNPPDTETWFFHVCGAGPNNGDIDVLVDIWYDVELTERKTVISS